MKANILAWSFAQCWNESSAKNGKCFLGSVEAGSNQTQNVPQSARSCLPDSLNVTIAFKLLEKGENRDGLVV